MSLRSVSRSLQHSLLALQPTLLLGLLFLIAPLAQPAFAETPTELVNQLQDQDKKIRSVAARKLMLMDTKAIPYLIQGMGHRSLKVQQGCTGILMRMKGRAVPALIKAGFSSRNKKVAKNCVVALIAIGEPSLPGLQALADSDDPMIANAARTVIEKINERAAKAAKPKKEDDPKNQIKALIAKFRSKNQNVRLGAAMQVSKFGAEAILPLTQALESEHDNDRRMAALSLSQMGKVALPALDTLVAHFGDALPEVRKACANACVKIGPAVQGKIVESSKSVEPEIRQWSCYTLGLLKADRKQSALALSKRIDDQSNFVRGAACVALCRVGFKGILNQAVFLAAPQSIGNFTAALNNRDPMVRANAALALLYYGQSAKKSSLIVANHLGDINVTVQKICVSILGNLGVNAVPSLKKAFKHRNPLARKNACVAAGRINEAAAELIPELEKLSSDKVKAVANAAKVALLRLKSGQKPAK